jgi:cell division protein FtsB
MIEVPELLKLHQDMVATWHQQPLCNPFEGVWHLICLQHSFNFELWHEEDKARDTLATDAQIAQVKRSIDRLNQCRNDYIEKIDDWISQYLIQKQICASVGASLRTETPGSAIDRLSIMSLRIYHYHEQCVRQDTATEHQHKVEQRLAVCKQQLADLSVALAALLDDIVTGNVQHRTYRQLKMYNDPSLNPYLSGTARSGLT